MLFFRIILALQKNWDGKIEDSHLTHSSSSLLFHGTWRTYYETHKEALIGKKKKKDKNFLKNKKSKGEPCLPDTDTNCGE